MSLPARAPAFYEHNLKAIEGTHIKFIEGPPKPKTKVWFVINKYDGIQLGWIAWFAKWRKYAFYPKPETVYEQVCLREIADFCEIETRHYNEQKHSKKDSKVQGN